MAYIYTYRTHLIFNVRADAVICNLNVQIIQCYSLPCYFSYITTLLSCLILQIGIILYSKNTVAQIFLLFTTLCYSSRYLCIVTNELQESH